MPKKNKEKDVRSLLYKNDDTEYAVVLKELGNSRFKIRLNLQNKELIGVLRGKFRHGPNKKHNIVSTESVVLVGLRDFENDMVDIIHVYKPDEVRQLKKQGELVDIGEGATKNKDSYNNDDEIPFIFEQL